MLHTNPILIIEDDEDDQILLQSIFTHLAVANQLFFFTTTDQALSYMQSSDVQPFLIMCSTGLPVNGGIEFKAFLEHHQSKLQGIPFVFLSTRVHSQFVKKAYAEISLQGIFLKPDSFEGFKQLIQTIYTYWQYSLHPDEDR